MNFLCPACRTPLPAAPALSVVPCAGCGVEVDLTGIDTAPGSARLWPDVDLSGDRLGGYQLSGRIGAGGMGAVYQAQGPEGRCAVKVLSALLAAEPGLRLRFRREAAALRAICHEGVVRVLAEGEERGFCWYAMERVDGPDLRARIAQARLTAAEVTDLARKLLAALKVVHAAGFVHRDVKPGNILLAPGGPKLCDFGIARFDGSTTLTESAAMMGSLRYMAPEQRLGRADARSDLYALGVVLHEALAGGVPGEADLPSGVPRRMRQLILALLADRPDHRPADAGAALARLEKEGRGGAISAAAVAGLMAVTGAALFGPGLLQGGPGPLPRPNAIAAPTAEVLGPAPGGVGSPDGSAALATALVQAAHPTPVPPGPGTGGSLTSLDTRETALVTSPATTGRAMERLRQAFASRRTRRSTAEPQALGTQFAGTGLSKRGTAAPVRGKGKLPRKLQAIDSEE